jgi:hypothetical protein
VRPLLRLFILLAACSAAPVFADTISLKNGRKIEGYIVSQSSSAVTIQVQGGVMDLPRSQIAEIEAKVSLEDEYAARAIKTDPCDPDALDRLSAWALAHHMELRARYLDDQAKGVRLEKAFARARTARDYLDIVAWARSQGFSTDVRRLAASKALALDPANARAKAELDAIGREEVLAERADSLARERQLEEREKAVADHEKWVATRERALAEAAKRGSETPATPPPATGTGDEAPPPPPTPPDDEGSGTGLIINYFPHRPAHDSSNDGAGNASSTTAPPSSKPTTPVAPNPIPRAPQLPPTPGFHSGSGASSSSSGH